MGKIVNSPVFAENNSESRKYLTKFLCLLFLDICHSSPTDINVHKHKLFFYLTKANFRKPIENIQQCPLYSSLPFTVIFSNRRNLVEGRWKDLTSRPEHESLSMHWPISENNATALII